MSRKQRLLLADNPNTGFRHRHYFIRAETSPGDSAPPQKWSQAIWIDGDQERGGMANKIAAAMNFAHKILHARMGFRFIIERFGVTNWKA